MIALALTTLVAAPQGVTYDPAARAAYLAEVLDAVHQADRAAAAKAQTYVSFLERNRCTSAMERVRVECMMVAARAWCRRNVLKDCALLTDLLADNALAERHFIPTQARYAIMEKHRDTRLAIRRELFRLHAALALDFYLTTGSGCGDDAQCLAPKIDRYCLDTADQSNLSWQACAGALVWFVGTAGGE